MNDVVVLAKDILQEEAQSTRLLGERDQEVVAQALVTKRALHDLGVTCQVVIATGHDRDDRTIRVTQIAFALFRGWQVGTDRGRCQGASRLSNDAIGLVEVQHFRAHRALGNNENIVDVQAGSIVGESPRTTNSGAVNERVNRCQRHWLASMQGSVHRGRPFGLDADDLDFGALSADPCRDAGK
ncbi:Uncharacterised protein [Chlamydia trachomatis]|nr:Uncharacterised protein [Chlamydia trachomatis]